jgi:glycosyltransferase involved in cell wall biosynthesis
MVTISCSGKFHAFALAEQMEKHGQLNTLFTTYSSRKNKIFNRFVNRIDKEEIPIGKIVTNTNLAFLIKLWQSKVHLWNELYDKWVAGNLSKKKSEIFIGWSGMSLHALRMAKHCGMITILERGSTHIEYQNKVLREEYKRFGIDYSIQAAVIKKELAEYAEADYISIPSSFVKKTFLEYGLPERKLLVNPYGAGRFFTGKRPDKTSGKFTIVYLGTLSIQKGLIYLFQAIHMLKISPDDLEIWFIGSIDEEMKSTIEQYKQANWKFFGHINHYELKDYLMQCDIGVQCSLQEGLSMVIPQMMSCGIPMIVTPNTGGENIITDGLNGYIIPERDPEAIAEKIEFLYRNREQMVNMQSEAQSAIQQGFTWDDYGKRYVDNLIMLKGKMEKV